jgi:tripartite-type tricarboxylate transporter receptor subunit TctC
MMAESGTLALPAVNPKVTLDPIKQFAPVGGVCILPMTFVVNPAFPAQNTNELIAALKASPGKYGYASPGVGTMQHLAFESFKRSAGVDALHIPYKGANAMMPDIMSGQVPIAVISTTAAMGPARSGKIRAIAVTSPQRVPSFPDWPAMAETLPGFSAAPRVFLVAPPGTPAPVVQKLSQAVAEIVRSPEVHKRLIDAGDQAFDMTPEQMAAFLREERQRWDTLIKAVGITAQ